jgi:hypothetical protein
MGWLLMGLVKVSGISSVLDGRFDPVLAFIDHVVGQPYSCDNLSPLKQTFQSLPYNAICGAYDR